MDTSTPGAPPESTNNHAARPVLELDIERYQHLLDDLSLSDAERAEFLTTIWNIMVEFVSLGYGIHPSQSTCGKATESDLGTSVLSPDLVSLDHQNISDKFKDVSGTKPGLTPKGVRP